MNTRRFRPLLGLTLLALAGCPPREPPVPAKDEPKPEPSKTVSTSTTEAPSEEVPK